MKFFITLAFLLFIFTNAEAQINCHTDSFDNTRCNGTDSNGNYINTNSHTDTFGNTRHYGF